MYMYACVGAQPCSPNPHTFVTRELGLTGKVDLSAAQTGLVLVDFLACCISPGPAHLDTALPPCG
jgi:hypothetical protein